MARHPNPALSEWIRRYRAGESFRAIAQDHDVSRQAIQAALRRAGISSRPPGRQPSVRDEYPKWIALAERGLHPEEIADSPEIQASHWTIRRRLRKMGVPYVRKTSSSTKGPDSVGGKCHRLRRLGLKWREIANLLDLDRYWIACSRAQRYADRHGLSWRISRQEILKARADPDRSRKISAILAE